MNVQLNEKFKQPEDLKEDLNVLIGTVPEVDLIIDPGLQPDLPTSNEDDDAEEQEQKTKEQQKFICQLDLMINLLRESRVDTVESEVDQRFTQINEQIRNNLREVLDKIRPLEELLRSANLFFENAGTYSKNAYFITVDPKRFVGTRNSTHFKVMCDYLRKEFYAWKIEKSPAFIGYIGDLSKGASEMAAIAEETVATAVVDVMFTDSVGTVLKRTKDRNLRGDTSLWGHLAVSATWLEARKAYKYENKNIEPGPLHIPSASAIIGKLMATETGKHITGFENVGLSGVSNIAYKENSDTRDSPMFRESGMMLLVNMDGAVNIIADRTANTSDDDDYRKLSKMVVRNKIMKDLVTFCNLKVDSRHDHRLKKQITNYLNDCKRLGMVKDYKDLKVREINADEVDVTVKLVYFDTKSRFNISIAGTRGELDVNEEKNS